MGPLTRARAHSPFKKVKFFIYCAIFMKFETYYFNCLPIIMEIEIYEQQPLYPPGASNSSFMVQFC